MSPFQWIGLGLLVGILLGAWLTHMTIRSIIRDQERVEKWRAEKYRRDRGEVVDWEAFDATFKQMDELGKSMRKIFK